VDCDAGNRPPFSVLFHLKIPFPVLGMLVSMTEFRNEPGRPDTLGSCADERDGNLTLGKVQRLRFEPREGAAQGFGINGRPHRFCRVDVQAAVRAHITPEHVRTADSSPALVATAAGAAPAAGGGGGTTVAAAAGGGAGTASRGATLADGVGDDGALEGSREPVVPPDVGAAGGGASVGVTGTVARVAT